MRRVAIFLAIFLFFTGPATAQPVVCAVCGQPIQGQGYRLKDGRTVCLRDIDSVLPHCAICGTALRSTYIEVGVRHTPVCDACMESRPRCWVCGEPLPEMGGRRLKDGRYLCPSDRKQAIFSPQAAERLFAQASREVVKSLGGRLAIQVPVESVCLVDLPRMEVEAAESDSKAEKAPTGLTRIRVVEVDGKRTVLPPRVFLLTGMPREQFLTVAAHEYGHVWHSQAHPDYLECSRRLREGFAEWVSYKVVERLGRLDQLNRLLGPRSDPDYSEGLRLMLALEQSVGEEGVLDYVVTHRDIAAVRREP